MIYDEDYSFEEWGIMDGATLVVENNIMATQLCEEHHLTDLEEKKFDFATATLLMHNAQASNSI